MPPAIPLIIPLLLIVARLVSVLPQVPPAKTSVIGVTVSAPAHTDDGPAIEGGVAGTVLIDMFFILFVGPQLLLTA